MRQSWIGQGIAFEERRVDQNQEWLDELLNYSDASPTVIYPDGRVEIGFEGHVG